MNKTETLLLFNLLRLLESTIIHLSQFPQRKTFSNLFVLVKRT